MADFNGFVPFDTDALQYNELAPEADFESIPIDLLTETQTSEYRCRSKIIACALQIPGQEPIYADNRVESAPDNGDCPRLLKNVDGYADCKLGCRQRAHAEIMILLKYLTKQFGINKTQFIDDEYPMSYSHEKLMTFFNNYPKYLIPTGSRLELWGHHACCQYCAQALKAAGVTHIFVKPSTEQESRQLARQNLPLVN